MAAGASDGPEGPDPRSLTAVRATSPAVITAVAVGGALGALARHGVSEVSGEGWSRAIAGTFAVNLAGCFVLGLLVAAVIERVPPSPVVRALLVTGLLGGFTTFSALALQVRDGLADESVAVTVAYVVATLALGPPAVRLGMLLTGAPPPRAHDAVREPV